MQKTLLSIAAICAGAIVWGHLRGQGSRDEEVTQAQIRVSPKDARGEISPFLFGSSIEWVDNGNGIFDPVRGVIRPEIVEALRPLRVPVFRFPGGILSDYYHWRDGIGPRASRPRRHNPMDGSEYENTFGTDEFIELCRALNAQPLVTANFGTGNLDEALTWQKYFLDHGLPARFWEIGNEIYLTEPTAHASIAGNDARIYKSSADYTAHFPEWANAIRSADPQARVGAIAGASNANREHRDWMQALTQNAVSNADFIALHNSFAPLIRGEYDFGDREHRHEAYRGMFAQSKFTGVDIQNVQRDARQVNPNIQIAITEHFPLFGFGGSKSQLARILDQSRTLASALFTASLFHTYMRQGVWMANYNLTVSKWFGALLTEGPTLVRTPTYWVFDLYRNHFGSQLVGSAVDGPTFTSSQIGSVPAGKNIGYLDVIASTDQAGQLYLAVINRALSKSVPAIINIDGIPDGATAAALTLTAASANTINGNALSSSTQPANIAPVAADLQTGDTHPVTFAPHSITIIHWKPAGQP
ncbi:MAG TPA: alpha-L-arabinofuranosidase C-terminal domain-containing protein [Bryobacteraceae bacterium]|jgi:alpha-N-arabinofuranosidase|nr:alpha-L-arabinofuranosidase C-terminal domain-containing protein [Bryobacteraceae bacterium]